MPVPWEERSGLLQNDQNRGNQPGIMRQDNTIASLIQLAITGIAGIMTVITFFLGIYRGVVVEHYGGSYFMLGFSFLIQILMESLLVVYIRNGNLQGNKTTYLYILTGFAILQSIFTNIVLFS